MQTATLCTTCRFNEPHSFYLAGAWTTGRRCFHRVVTFPTASHCERYEREPGVD